MTAESPDYVAARRTLLDALDLLAAQRDSLVLVGAQAVYLRAPFGDSRPTYTTDADFALDPDLVTSIPDMGAILEQAGFSLNSTGNPGSWTSPTGVVVDLMVPAARVPGARRAAPLAGQQARTARAAAGLEVSLHDNTWETIHPLDSIDPRVGRVRVAGPAALVVAKSIKVRERLRAGRAGRIVPKDAGDLLRLLRNIQPGDIGARLTALADDPELGSQILDVVGWLRTEAARRDGGGLLGLAIEDRRSIEAAPQVERSFSTLLQELVISVDGGNLDVTGQYQ